jgi:hypothetical protein
MTPTFNPDQQDEQRLALMKVFKERLGDVSSNIWALLWLSDLDKLQGLLAITSNNTILQATFHGLDNDTRFALKCQLMILLYLSLYTLTHAS